MSSEFIPKPEITTRKWKNGKLLIKTITAINSKEAVKERNTGMEKRRKLYIDQE